MHAELRMALQNELQELRAQQAMCPGRNGLPACGGSADSLVVVITGMGDDTLVAAGRCPSVLEVVGPAGEVGPKYVSAPAIVGPAAESCKVHAEAQGQPEHTWDQWACCCDASSATAHPTLANHEATIIKAASAHLSKCSKDCAPSALSSAQQWTHAIFKTQPR
jgi:hypothetical protein